MIDLTITQDEKHSCHCKTCVGMCEERPCWPTPEEAQKLIDAGMGGRLMQDYWVGDSRLPDTQILSPAIVGRENRGAPFIPFGRCTFLTQDGLCELHDLGLKPAEGRLAMCSENGGTSLNLHQEVAETWNTTEGRLTVAGWNEERS